MKIFLTGGSGFIGQRLVEKLVADRHEVVLLLRDPAAAGIRKNKAIKVIRGDLAQRQVLISGMAGCDLVFHLAAYVKPWSKDPHLPVETNIRGTENVLEAALASGIRRVIITSTGGTMGFSVDGKPVDETTNKDPLLYTEYERTKAGSEKIALDYCLKGLEVVILNPTRVFGPGKLSESNSVTKIIRWYLKGLWKIIPGDGTSVGNYAFIDDVVDGFILAAEKGIAGERYILGGENLSFNELFMTLGEVSGKRVRLIHIPIAVLKPLVKFFGLFNRLTGMPPIITEAWLNKYLSNWVISSQKAVTRLGYHITPFKTGAEITIKWFRSAE
ncbi:MAG: NAD-dependent epimerase/dehydratase family protein [Bacteroidales bacterium]